LAIIAPRRSPADPVPASLLGGTAKSSGYTNVAGRRRERDQNYSESNSANVRVATASSAMTRISILFNPLFPDPLYSIRSHRLAGPEPPSLRSADGGLHRLKQRLTGPTPRCPRLCDILGWREAERVDAPWPQPMLSVHPVRRRSSTTAWRGFPAQLLEISKQNFIATLSSALLQRDNHRPQIRKSRSGLPRRTPRVTDPKRTH
jgi:hypothetical protein